MSNSCVDCPALIAGQEAADFWGVDASEVGDYIFCSRYGHVLGDMVGVRVEVAKRYGTNCVSYGKGKPIAAPIPKMGIYEPRTDLLNPTDPNSRAKACTNCVNFDSAVNACAATGMLVFRSKAEVTAQTCAFGVIGPSTKTVGQTLVGWKGASVRFAGASTQAAPPPTRKPRSTKFKVIEPVDYDSDAKVSPEHAARGIKAWRLVTSPRGLEHYLPIFRTDFFSEEEQALIPSSKSDYGDPSLFIDHDNIEVEFAVQSYTKDMNLALIGDPGTGKTEGVRYLSWRMNMPFFRMTYNEESEPDQFLGMMQFGPHPEVQPDGSVREVTGTYFLPGDLPRAWTTIGVRLSDEPNLAPEAIVQAYRSMNDSSRELVVYHHRFIRHDYCFHIMAMNPHYDFRNIGAKPMASADSRRLSFHLMTAPDDEMTKAIIQRTVAKLDGGATVDDEVMTVILKASKDLREMSKNNQLPDFWTVSQDIKVARLVPDFGLVGAYRRAYFNYIDPETTNLAMTAIQTYIKNGSVWA